MAPPGIPVGVGVFVCALMEGGLGCNGTPPWYPYPPLGVALGRQTHFVPARIRQGTQFVSKIESQPTYRVTRTTPPSVLGRCHRVVRVVVLWIRWPVGRMRKAGGGGPPER